jgi:hypothetical protein
MSVGKACTTADGLPHGQTWILLSTVLVLGMSPGALDFRRIESTFRVPHAFSYIIF